MINPTTHVFALYNVPTPDAFPFGITNGPDGNLWFTEQQPVARSACAERKNRGHQSHDPRDLRIPLPTPNSLPSDITVGPDGNLWFTEQGANKIASINPTTHVITEFPIPLLNFKPFSIAAGSDGNLWFTPLATYNQIEEFNPTTHTFSWVAIPTASSDPIDIAAGPDGNLYFTEFKANQIAVLNPTTRNVTEFTSPTAASGPYGITAGPDHNVWFTESEVLENRSCHPEYTPGRDHPVARQHQPRRCIWPHGYGRGRLG